MTASFKESIFSAIHLLCLPKTSQFEDPIDHMIAYKRNKLFFWIFLLIILFIPVFMSAAGAPQDLYILVHSTHIINFIVFLCLCRSYQWIYNIFLVSFMVVFPIVLVNFAREVAFLQIGQSLMMPIIVLLFTKNHYYMALVVTVHIIVALTKTKHLIISNFQAMDPEIFGDRLVKSSLGVTVGTLIIFAVILDNLHKRTRELIQANKVSESLLEKQKTFLFSFSHEMRNPLNSLLGNLELALMEESLPGKVREMIVVSQICAEILLQQINNILDTGKHDLGSLEINLNQTKPKEIFRRIWTLSNELIVRKNLNSCLKIEKQIPPYLLLDFYRVNQIMMNLIGNAIKFTNRGSINITVKWLNCELVDDGCFEPVPYDSENEGVFDKDEIIHQLSQGAYYLNRGVNNYQSREYYILDNKHKDFEESPVRQQDIKEQKGVLKVIITDTGSGISENNIEKLFEKFSQVSKDPNERKVGSGLGLFITKEICKRLEGDARAYSKFGVGTTFVVCLPTISVPMRCGSSLQREASFPRNLGAQKNIACLVADDSPLNVAMVCNYFEKIGIKGVHRAGNGEEAVMMYQSMRESGKKVNVVTLDIDMPKMNGKEACKKIREYEKRKNLSASVIILISGNYEEDQVKKELNEGEDADWFLKKPLGFEEFSATITRLVDEKLCLLEEEDED